jgi:hypothetical protein
MWDRSYLWASMCHEIHTATDRVVWVHYSRDKHCTPQQPLMTVLPGRMHALMMVSKSQWSDQRHVQDRCPRLPSDTNKNAHCRAQLAAITHLPAEASIIYFHNFATPCQLPFKNSCKGQIKKKPNIALQQNCDQWATAWWSKWSSA